MAKQVISYLEARAKGLKRYYTGKPCKNGHLSERYVVHCGCIECAYERTDIWGKKNPELKNAFIRDWFNRNKDYPAEWAKNNPDSIKRSKRKWYRANVDRQIATAIAWRKRNPEKARAIIRNRMARKKNAKGSHTAEQIIALLKRQKWKCAACGISIRERRHIDHIIPLASGGSNGIKNLQGLCPTCNCSKGAKDPLVWEAERRRLSA